MNIKQRFKVYCSTNLQEQKNKELLYNVQEDKDSKFLLEGIASSTNIDLEGDYITETCLEDMKKQAMGLNILLNHDQKLDSIVGKVEDVLETSSDVFKIKFSVLPSYTWYIQEFLDNDINLGLSIGASVLDYEQTDTGWKINKVKLHEISLVAIPANWDTYGTVRTSKELGMITAKCFNGACKQIIDEMTLPKSNEIVKELEDGEEADDDGIITEKEVISIFNEFGIELKNQIIAEIVSEYNLDGKKYSDTEESDEDTASSEQDEKENNSSDDDSEDKEKNLDMEKEEIIELIKEYALNEEIVKSIVDEALEKDNEETVTEDAPIVKEGESEVTKKKDSDEEEDNEESEDDDEKDSDEEDDGKNKEKSLNSSVRSNNVDLDNLKKELKKELTPQIREEIEKEFFKELSIEREPVPHEQPNVQKEAKISEEKEKSSNVMNRGDLAKHLLGY